MTFARGEHPASLANLQKASAFRPGYDPRRSVGRAFGRSLIEWLNELTKPAKSEDGTAAYPLSELREIAADETTDHARGTAAALILAIRDQAWDKLDRMPRSLQTIKEILDRQLGKAAVQIEVDVHAHANEPMDFASIVGQLRTRSPGHLKMLGQMLELAEMPCDELPAYLDVPGNANFDPNYYATDGSPAVALGVEETIAEAGVEE